MLNWIKYPETEPPQSVPLWCTFANNTVGEACYDGQGLFFSEDGYIFDRDVLAFIVLPGPYAL